MVGEPDATMQPAPQDIQLMSKHRVLGFKPYLRLERRGQDGQNEEQPDHSASLGDSIASSTRIRFSLHTMDPHLGRVRASHDKQVPLRDTVSIQLGIELERAMDHPHLCAMLKRRHGISRRHSASPQ
jgi:hypothetical protein